jgi:hypothetical protein
MNRTRFDPMMFGTNSGLLRALPETALRVFSGRSRTFTDSSSPVLEVLCSR